MVAFKRLVELSTIIEDMLFKVFSTQMIKKPRKELVLSRSSRLKELSVDLGRWHTNLPVELSWNQWNPTPKTMQRHILMLQ